MTPGESERSLSDLDQSFAEDEQSASDLDQTFSESDETVSERDQKASDHDQQAADIDQDRSEHPGERTDPALFEHTRQMRADSTVERGVATHLRSSTAVARDRVARQRDQLSAARDLASAARDELAAALDAEIERLERQASEEPQRNGLHVDLKAAHERQLAARSRAQAAAHRQAAAEDRAHAATDRELAALDRLSCAKELASAEVDEVTGALRRRVGLAALQRELDRTRRTKEQLTVVFIDVDGLKHVNDEVGHIAGDQLLRTVVTCVGEEFRSYDVILRFGGDEFVCSLSGETMEGIGARFERIAERLGEKFAGARISIGVSERRADDTVDTLIDRADRAMLATRATAARSCDPAA
jgi:diguanylate cyclase (GGDEF)-like protein